MLKIGNTCSQSFTKNVYRPSRFESFSQRLRLYLARSVTNFTAVSIKNYIARSYLGDRNFLDGLAFSISIVEAVKHVFEPVRTW